MKEMETVKINDYEMPVREYRGKRVVTFRDIDTFHGRPEGTAGRNFNYNKKHFIEGEDYFEISQYYEIKKLGIEGPQGGTPKKVKVFTKQGYLMIIKSFNDDLAWKMYRIAAKGLFNTKEDMIRKKINEFCKNNLYSDWCYQLQEPLVIIQMHYNLPTARSALAHVYDTFKKINGRTVNDVRNEYIRLNADKYEDPYEFTRYISAMPMLKFIHSQEEFKEEITHIIWDMVSYCNNAS